MKVKTSVLVSGLSGSSGDVTAFSWKGRQAVRTRVIPANPNSESQQVVRGALTRLVACFKPLAAGVKTFLDTLGNERQVSGFNVYVGDNFSAERSDHMHPVMPTNRHCDPVVGLAAATGSGAGEIDLTWTPTGWTTDDVPVILYRKKNAEGDEYETPWTSYDPGAVDMTAGAITIEDLDSDTDYAIALFPHDQSASAYGGGMVKHATSLA